MPETTVFAPRTGRGQRLVSKLDAGGTVDLRGHGKAGGGLVLAIQSFAASLADLPGIDVQEWPLFSSARKGANVASYLRVGRGTVEMASQITEPDVVVLMNEAAAKEVDFAEGTRNALFVVNTRRTPQEAADTWRLTGTVVTIPGDDLGLKHLGKPLANIAVFAALVQATELVSLPIAREALQHQLEKRRLPQRLIDANLRLFDDALGGMRSAEAEGGDAAHVRTRFTGYGALPAGGQSALRTSVKNMTANYGRPGVRIEFHDAAHKCNGCALCVAQCPEGIMLFEPDEARGPIVKGALFDEYCKVCRECVAACPLDLFHAVDAVARPEGAVIGG